MSNWFKDSTGNTFQTPDGKAPGSCGIHIKISDGYGGTKDGMWNGTHAIPNK